MAGADEVRTWRPDVPGVAEVLHARFTEHVYPMHVHETWTLLVVDHGTVAFDLSRERHGVDRHEVTLLPPHVPHNGAPASSDGFRKRVLYLRREVLDAGLVGLGVDRPVVADAALRHRVDLVHRRLAERGESLAAEVHLSLVVDRLRRHLQRRAAGPAEPRSVAVALRDLLDATYPDAVTLAELAAQLDRPASSLVRAFTREFGMAPHQYVVARRVERARLLLLDGVPPARAAVEAGFHDQPHLNRHFRRLLGFTPGTYRGLTAHRFASAGAPESVCSLSRASGRP